MTHLEHFDRLLKDIPEFGLICKSIIKECPSTAKPVIAFKGKWWYMELTDDGVPFPSKNQCLSLEKNPSGTSTVWNLLHMKEATERFVTSLQRAMFYTWGQGNKGENGEWLEIDLLGETNYPIQDLDTKACQALLKAVDSWVDGKSVGVLTLTFCTNDERFEKCRCCFDQTYVTDSRSPICPFARVHDGNVFQWSSCYTAKMEGVLLDQVEEAFAECHIRGHGLNDHPRGIEAKMWLAVMQTFLKNKIKELSC